MQPKWTVVTNILSPESTRWIGKSWEFFDEEEQAQQCYERHATVGEVPTKRPFYKQADMAHMNPIDARSLLAADAAVGKSK